MPQSDCLTVAWPLTAPSSPAVRSSASGRVLSPSVSSPSTRVPCTDVDRFGEGHGFNTSPSPGTPEAISRTTAKIRDKGRLLAGMALDAPADSLEWDNGAWSAGGEYKTLEDVALYAHGTGALPPGVEGGLDAQTVYRD